MMNRFTYLSVFILVVSVFVNTRIAYAAAGDSIGNMATVGYVFLGTPRLQESSPTGTTFPGVGKGSLTSFVEDRLVNFNVVATDASVVTVVTAQAEAVLTFVVTNNGNAVQDYLLSAVNTTANPFGLPPENINPLTRSVFVEDGATPGYQLLEDTATFIDELAVATSVEVYIVASIPASSSDDVAAVSLVVQVATGGAVGEGSVISNDDDGNASPAGVFSNGATITVSGTANDILDTAALEVVFNDPAGLSAEDIDSSAAQVQDVARNGQHSDTGAFVVQDASAVMINKTVTVLDTLGGNDPHQGATLRYQLDVTINGIGSVDDLIITDAIPANTTYTPASIVLNSISQTDLDFAADGIDHAMFNGADVIVDLSEQSTKTLTVADSPITIIFDVTID